ncbi:hypothetical protein FBU30_010251 [Linnemannia zychae]|nr:hypothetical protein FBU30_010251 [Linnemannia zychae]
MEIDPPAFRQTTDTSSPPVAVASNGNSNLISFPRKRPLQQDDPFFLEGNYEYKAAWLKLEDSNTYIPDLNEPEKSSYRTTAQTCHYGSCHGERTFSNAALYEYHFDTNHRHICQTCKKVFPGEKWLIFHIREIHDVLVRIQRERGERTYQCYVDGCDRLCSTPQKRRMHLIDKHQYPKHFNFSIVVTGNLPSSEKMAKIQKQNAREARKQAQHIAPHRQQYSKDYDMADEHLMDVEPFDLTQDPRAANTNRSKSTPLESGSNKSTVVSSRIAKKNAFQQYRSPDTKSKPAVKRSLIPVDHIDMDMDVSLDSSLSDSTAVTSPRTPSQTDMDMDQLQFSMSRLMIPRSVIRAIIASYMDLDVLCTAALVSQSWYETCIPLIWKNIAWTSQLKERPTLEAISTNAQYIRTLTVYTLKLDIAENTHGGDQYVGGLDIETSEGEAKGENRDDETSRSGDTAAEQTGTKASAIVGRDHRFPFAACTKIEDLNLQLNIRQAEIWDHLTNLVRNNTELKALTVFLSGVPVTMEFMQALIRKESPLSSLSPSSPNTSLSSPHKAGSTSGGLKMFTTMFLDLNKEMTEALLDLATQLESLQLNGATTVDPGSLDRWPVFPNLTTLKLSLNSGITPFHQLQIIQRCPKLQSLAWDLEESAISDLALLEGSFIPNTDETAFYNCRFPTKAVSELFRPDACPELEMISINYPHLPDRDLVQIVEACPKLTMFEVFETGFGALTFHALIRHFANLTRLDIRRCRGVTSPMAQQILTSCRKLVYFCGDTLHARDIVGLQESQETETETMLQELRPQEWVCTDLTWLTLYICGLENAPPTWLPIVYHQLSRLSSLDFLTISPQIELDGTKDGLPLNLSSGLSTLATLTNLERFCFHGLIQEMDEADVQWMVDSWPKLIRVEGVVHPDRERRIVLEPILRSEGVELCGYFGDEDDDELELRIIASDTEDNDMGGIEENLQDLVEVENQVPETFPTPPPAQED